jgi:hypothetical protein
MARKIHISADNVSMLAELNATHTAEAIWDALPIRADGNRWGDEIYFEIPVSLETEKGQSTVEMGDLGYWSPGHAFCIFFGPTPASRGDEIRPASAVTVFGQVQGDASAFRDVPDGEEVLVERAD